MIARFRIKNIAMDKKGDLTIIKGSIYNKETILDSRR